MTATRTPIGGGAALAGAVLLERAVHRRDRRAIARDPEQARLSRPLRGQPVDVRSRDGTRLHVELFGPEDAKPIVFVHGWTCRLRFWTCQIQALSERYRVIAFDLRGHGQSAPPKGDGFSAEALAHDLQSVLEAAVPNGVRALIVGHSLGAMTILAWASEYPHEVAERASAAMLISTGVSKLALETKLVPLPPGRIKMAVGAALLASKAALPPPSPITHRAIRAVALSPQASPAQVAFCQEQILGCSTEARAGCGRLLSTLDLDHAVQHLAVPTIVVAGSRDRLTPQTHTHRLAEQLIHMLDVVELDEIGHMAPVEAPDEITAHIERLANLNASRRA